MKGDALGVLPSEGRSTSPHGGASRAEQALELHVGHHVAVSAVAKFAAQGGIEFLEARGEQDGADVQ